MMYTEIINEVRTLLFRWCVCIFCSNCHFMLCENDKFGIFSKFVFFETIYWEKTLHLTKKLTLGFEAFPLMCVNRRLEKRKKGSFREKIANCTHHKVDFDGWRVLNAGGWTLKKRKYWCHLSESPILELFEKTIYWNKIPHLTEKLVVFTLFERPAPSSEDPWTLKVHFRIKFTIFSRNCVFLLPVTFFKPPPPSSDKVSNFDTLSKIL